MANKPQRVFWDSCVIIDYLQQEVTRYPDIRPMVERAEKGQLHIVVSEISVAEVIKLEKLAIRGVDIADQTSIIGEWFEFPYVIPRIVDRRISFLAAQIKRNHNVKTCDAVILATAIRHDVNFVYTYDGLQDNQSINNNRLLALDGTIPTSNSGQFLRIIPPNGRVEIDGQTNMPV